MRTLFQLSSHWVLIQQKGARKLSGVSFIRVKIPFTLPTKIYLVKAVVFLLVMYECESGTIKLSAEELTILNWGVGEYS